MRFCLWAAFALLCFGACGEPVARKPTIILITIDTLRADHLGSYGYFRDTSPNIDRIAENAALFANVVTPMATTLPAHAALFTSRYPVQTGITTNGIKIKIQEEAGNKQLFLAEMLKSLGYSTAAFVSANPVKEYTGINAGFDHFDEPRRSEEPLNRRGKANETTSAVLDWLATAPDEPFFLWIHYFDPHKPFDPPEDFRDAFSTDDELIELMRRRGIADPLDEKLQRFHNLYDGEILFVDSQIARLTGRLRELGIFDDSVFIITSDHGEALGERGRIGHGEIYNEQLFVPLIIKYPQGSAHNGQRVERMASLTDVIPTLVSSLKLDLDPQVTERFAGIDLFDRRQRRPYALAQRTTRVGRRWGKGDRFALVGESWKYLYATDGDDAIFDMRNDRSELANQIESEPELANRMKDRLLSEIARYSATRGGIEVIEATSPEVLEELRALGYIE